MSVKKSGMIIVNETASHLRFWNGKEFVAERWRSKVLFQSAATMRHLTKASVLHPGSTITAMCYETLEEFLKVVPGPRLICVRTDNVQVYDMIVDLLNDENIDSFTQEFRWDAARYNRLMDVLEK